ncbi:MULTISPECIES: prephenate dehydratase [Persicobacter]|uniref:Bifunctional chorismate mutase/prephenate dehydratase n=1 Tax=Persicobacter diffluens TaxID=981 RepID=A0AAN4VV41_9BACT|nr:prephenate dehydratase [Persicobacter sp. CCB-QB2]GJM59493.1 chorismate mutase [Persicobacter diffluens]
MENLDALRQKIDDIDEQMLQLLNDRMEVVKEVGHLKAHHKTVIYRPEREKAIIDRLAKLSKGSFNRSAIEAVFHQIFAISRNLELPERIAYLGPMNSFTHQAAESRFGALSEYLPLTTISKVFDAVSTGKVRFGVVPIENNQEGIVADTIDLLGKHDLNIVAEVAMPIHFAFGTKENSVKSIKKIYSRDIAFRQCKSFLGEFFEEGQVELIPVNSTSKAVKMAAEEEGAAALCSHVAAREYALPILYENVEDSEDNFTRFLILGKEIVNKQSGKDKTTILAKIGDNPGALVNMLQDFYQAGINLTKIESRPAKEGKNFKYWFFIDFEGHIEDESAKAVMMVNRDKIKFLGSYVRMC